MTRTAAVSAVAGVALLAAAGAAHAELSTGWLPNNASRVVTIHGCSIVQSGSTNYVLASENTNCAGDVGLTAKYVSGGVTYVTATKWALRDVRIDRTNITQVMIHHK
ncbi:hypothetical protein GXP71_00970 [Cellulomonas sp. H30R-01]|jgi:hypothetical protein|uniref:hypothetical protein n=1 Tax=Cellulomonas sp. H30R-01 TaxID=2704467 RepID=UPI00138D0881|nr:hypothetical protein [Cellulomonas sp. H30R-01]QHT54807.1 hypothetical protein GXP71_00970 [Cellulomonas sp. H30R-01]